MSYEKDQFGGGGGGGGEGSVSISTMISTALVPYVKSASLVTALGTYVTSASLNTALGAYVTSSSLNTALATYVTSSSLATALGTYITSNSASIALALKQPNFSVSDEGTTLSTVAGTVTTMNFVGSGISASLTGGILTVTSVAGAGSGEGSVSISTMISTALAPYLTSASAVSGYARLASGNVFTSVAGQTFLATGAGTSGAVAIRQTSGDTAGGYIQWTDNAVANQKGYIVVDTSSNMAFGTGATDRLQITSGGDVNVLGPLAVSATASCAAITLAGKPVGCVLLGYKTLSNVNSFGFSGSWSDYAILQARALYRIETGSSATASAAIYTDGGTTAFLSLGTASTTQSANQIISIEYHVYGGDGRPIKLMEVNSRKQTNLQTFAVTATANTGFVNCIRYFSSATITAGMAVLYGFRKA